MPRTEDAQDRWRRQREQRTDSSLPTSFVVMLPDVTHTSLHLQKERIGQATEQTHMTKIEELNLDTTTPDEFLSVLCPNGKAAAQLVLRWASNEPRKTVGFLSDFLSRVFSELDIHHCYLGSNDSPTASFSTWRPSVSSVEFGEFCDALRGHPGLIAKVREQPGYPKGVEADLWFFGDHGTRAQLRRDKSERQRLENERSRRAIEAYREEKRAERRAEVEPKVELRKADSKWRKDVRSRLAQLPVKDQLNLALSSNRIPIKVFPIDPHSVDQALIESLNWEQLSRLRELLRAYRSAAWQTIARRVEDLRRQRLREAYLQTDFRFDVDGVWHRFRIGDRSEKIDELLSNRGAAYWAFITAWNPDSAPLSDRENDVRHERLCELLSKLELEYVDGFGDDPAGNWKSERSVLILGIDRASANGIGYRFGQAAIVVGSLGGPAELLWCAG